MRFLRKLVDSKKIELKTAIRFYPPFVFLRLKVRVRSDYMRVNAVIPNRWFLRNNNNSVFGGVMLLVSDPFPALLFEHHFENCQAWTVNHSITYLRPSYGEIHMQVDITHEDINYMKTALLNKRSVVKEFTYFFEDERGHKIAEVKNVSCLRKKKSC